MKRLLTALAVAALAACSPHYPAGPDGTVTGRDAIYRSKNGGWFYYLTVDGTKFRVTRDDYQHCFRGSRYPQCADRSAR